MISLPPGDPPKPAEIEALVEEEAEREGLMAVDLAVANNEIRQLASLLLKIYYEGNDRVRRDIGEISSRYLFKLDLSDDLEEIVACMVDLKDDVDEAIDL
ncbi:hypothetical protein A2U01_0003634, partial [Trifolium medium]|nr:hypothetical protein [Trifolium medium]